VFENAEASLTPGAPRNHATACRQWEQPPHDPRGRSIQANRESRTGAGEWVPASPDDVANITEPVGVRHAGGALWPAPSEPPERSWVAGARGAVASRTIGVVLAYRLRSLSAFGPTQTARTPLVQPTAHPPCGLLALRHAVLLSSTAGPRLRVAAVQVNVLAVSDPHLIFGGNRDREKGAFDCSSSGSRCPRAVPAGVRMTLLDRGAATAAGGAGSPDTGS
jgi:hypothetical protein